MRASTCSICVCLLFILSVASLHAAGPLASEQGPFPRVEEAENYEAANPAPAITPIVVGRTYTAESFEQADTQPAGLFWLILGVALFWLFPILLPRIAPNLVARWAAPGSPRYTV